MEFNRPRYKNRAIEYFQWTNITKIKDKISFTD